MSGRRLERWITGLQLRRALVGWGMLGGLLVVVAILAVALGTSALERTFTDFLLTAMFVLSLQLFVGNSGIVSFGHAAFAGLGAYAAALVTIPTVLKETSLERLPPAILRVELGLWESVLIGIVLCVVFALLVGGAMTRMQELAMAMATLALLVVAHTVFVNWDAVTRGTYGIFGIPGNVGLWVALGGLLLLSLIARIYRDSRVGLRLRATREDPLATRALGVNVAAARLGAWVLSAAAMGASGAMFAQHVLAFDPDQFFFIFTFTTLSMLVIGGRASVTGAIVGAAVISVVSEVLRPVERGEGLGPIPVPELPGLIQLAIAGLIIVVLVLRPEGVFGRWELDDVVLRPLKRRGAGPHHRRVEGDGAREEQGPEVGGGAEASPVGAEAPGPANGRGSADGAVLRAERVSKDFHGLRALKEVDLALGSGEILGLIGPNGSGKTTLINIVSGVLPSSGGRVFVGERDVTGLPAHRIARLGLARTFQNIRLFREMTVRENVGVGAGAGVSERDVDATLRELDLGSVANTLTGSLPYGTQRRVEIARAVIRRPVVLLLDEPAAGMNESESEQLLSTISAVRERLGCSMVVIDHDLRLILRLCDRVQVLNEGVTISAGAPEAVSTDPAVVKAYLGTARRSA